MTDTDEIKFAIRYLKQGLKSKRTPPLYEELMKELGFVKKDKVQELEKENVELIGKVAFLENDLNNAKAQIEKMKADVELARDNAISRTYPKFEINRIANFVLREDEEAFLEGLKAGRPEWHKVADGDLPKENKLYLVAIKDNGLAIAYFNGRHWETKFNLGDFGHLVETVIAWCEIPTFTDKE